MKYNVPVKWLATGYVEVEAEDAEDLLRKLVNESFVNGLPFPETSEAVEHTYSIDFDQLEKDYT